MVDTTHIFSTPKITLEKFAGKVLSLLYAMLQVCQNRNFLRFACVFLKDVGIGLGGNFAGKDQGIASTHPIWKAVLQLTCRKKKAMAIPSQLPRENQRLPRENTKSTKNV